MPAFNHVYGPHGAVTELHEVWLLDTGYFLVLRDIPIFWETSLYWRKIMRQRRVLRFFLPDTEIGRLPAITTTFRVAKRGFEIRDGLARVPALSTLIAQAVDATKATDVTAMRRALDGVIAQAVATSAALATPLNHAKLLPPEMTSPIQTVPWMPPHHSRNRSDLIGWFAEEDRKKAEARAKAEKARKSA